MKDGRIVKRGTHDELMRARGGYHDMLARQVTEHRGDPPVIVG
jgi:ABC-type multidrug transport system fused ATPase/permease subunit